jgi:hypothetical protein
MESVTTSFADDGFEVTFSQREPVHALSDGSIGDGRLYGEVGQNERIR